MAVSIIQLSKIAGVSKSTVSRVLNDSPRVSPEAARAVRQAAEKLGYSKPERRVGRPRRNPMGIRKGTIVILFPDTNPRALRTVLSGQLLHGIESILRRRGVSLLVTGLPDTGRLPACIEQKQVDGVLIRGHLTGPLRDQMFAGLGSIPCVEIFEPRGWVPEHWDIVLEDNDSIAEMAVAFLNKRQRRNLVCINPMPEHPSTRHRSRSFVEFAGDVQIPARSYTKSASAVEMAKQVLGDGPVDGVFVPGSDDSVIELYRALLEQNLEVGKQYDLISVNNDTDRLWALNPTLANIDIQAEAIGRAAAETMLARLQYPGEPRRRITIAPKLIEPSLPAPAN